MYALLRASLIGLLIVTLVESPVLGAPPRALGLIMQADRAHVSSAEAMSGATVFDGDILSTDSAGALRARLGEAHIYLLANSVMSIQRIAGGVSATLQRGTTVFSSPGGEAFELRASEARIRGQATRPTYAQVTLVGPYELLVTCQRGQLDVQIGEEVHAVPESTSYRVLIEPATQELQGAGGPAKAARNRFILIALILIGVGTGIGIWRALISPSSP